MSYIDGFLIAVPTVNKQAFIDHATKADSFFIEQGALRVLECWIAVTYAGGITHVKRIVDLAGLHHVRTGFHGAPSHSPISMAAQHHLNAWAPNFGIQEYLVLGTPECDALFPSAHLMENGMVFVSDAPGLGVDFDEAEAARYEYNPGSHPVVRLEDGTIWNY